MTFDKILKSLNNLYPELKWITTKSVAWLMERGHTRNSWPKIWLENYSQKEIFMSILTSIVSIFHVYTKYLTV